MYGAKRCTFDACKQCMLNSARMSQTSVSSPIVPRVYVFDLDGVLYRGDEPVPAAAECIARLRARQDPPARLFFLTNNSMQPRRVFAEKLTRLGMPATEDEVVTSSSATADYIVQIHGDDVRHRKALVLGGAGIVDELSRVGLIVRHVGDADFSDEERFDYLVVGLDRELSYTRLLRAQQAVLHGATLIATNRDGQYPVENGRVTPGAGSIVAAVEAATDRKAVSIGKPEPLGLETVMRLAEATPAETVMIGDRLDTDILCGNRLQVPSVLVLTGLTDGMKAANAPLDQKPGRVIKDLSEL